MQLNVHVPSENQFNKYTDESVTIKDQEYFNDIIIFNTTVKNVNPIYNISDLDLNYLSEIINSKPDLVIIGTGKKIIYPKMEVLINIQNNGIGIEIMTIKSLCRTFNFLVSENRKIAAIVLFNIN